MNAAYSSSGDFHSDGRRSDLDWALPSSVMRSFGQFRRPPSGGWHFGDRRKRKLVVSQFAKSSTMHGIRFVCSGNSNTFWLRRLLYSLFFVTAVVAMVGSVVTLVLESFKKESVYVSSTSKETRTGPDEDPGHFPDFPRIVLCRRPPYRMDDGVDLELMEYAFLSLGYPFSPLTPAEISLMVMVRGFKQKYGAMMRMPPALRNFSATLDRLRERYEQLKQSDAAFNLTRYIVDGSASCASVFVRCFSYVFAKNCCEIFEPRLTSLGLCYSLVLDDDMLGLFQRSKGLNMHFTFDLHPAPHPKKAVQMGYEIYLLDPRDRDLGFPYVNHALINGFMTTMRTHLVKTSRLALNTAWHGLSYRCPRLPPELDLGGYGERYFRHGCEKNYMFKMIRDKCQCHMITDASHRGVRQCDPVDLYGCFVDTALSDNLTGMEEQCAHACIEYEYRSEVNFVKIGDNCSRLVFMYDGLHYSLHKYTTTTLSGFLSQIGGALGLYLGASIITAAELLIFGASWLWYRCLPHRTVTDAVPRRRTWDKDSYLYR